MAVIHISEAEALQDFAGLLSQVRSGVEIVIESAAQPAVVLHTARPPRRTVRECIALLPEHSDATLDDDFGLDLEAVISSHREPLPMPDWD